MKKLTIDEMKNLAKSRQGECLSDIYIDLNTPLIWRCKYNHIWETKPQTIKQGSWCPFCANVKIEITKIVDLAETHNGKFILNQPYKNNKNLTFSCSNGHTWTTSLIVIQRGGWCPFCAGVDKKSIEYATNLATERGGKLISTTYKNANTKMEWECKNGHLFQRTVSELTSKGSWCPYCSKWSSEEICRRYFETIFNKAFPKCRPNWLIGINNIKLELDGYCAELKLAFEHNGTHHYENNKSLFKHKNQFENDLIKQKLCSDNDISLIVIPQLFSMTKLSDIKNIIKNACAKFGVELSINYDSINISYDGLSYSDLNDQKLEKLKLMIQNKNGILLNNEYVHSRAPIHVRCSEGHEWETSYSRIMQGAWCKQCANIKLSIMKRK